MNRARSVPSVFAPFAVLAIPWLAVAQVGSPAVGGPAASASASASSEPAPDSDETAPAPAPSAAPYAPIVLSPGVPAAPPAKRPIDPAKEPPAAPARGPWYGWQILAADLAIAGTTAVLLRTQDEDAHLPIFLGGAALFATVSPLLHVANGNGARFLDSLLVHSLSVGLGAAAGATLIEGAAGCGEGVECKLSTVDFAALGAGVGAIVAPIWDATSYAWKPAAKLTAHARPFVRSTATSATFGIAVAF